MIRDTFARAAVLAALVVALTGCVAAPAPAPSVDPTGTPGATTTPDPEPASRAAVLVIEAERFVLLDDEGAELLVHDWEDPLGNVVAALDEAFGTSAQIEDVPGDCCHGAPFRVHRWGGVEFWFADLGDAPRESYAWPSQLIATTPEVGGVEIRTAGGARVGWSVDRLLALGAPYHTATFEGRDETYYWIDATRPAEPMGSSDPTRAVAVVVDGTGTVVNISAPALADGP